MRIVFKHNPLGFHQRAMPAAMASECARDQGKFWEMHDKIFANQRALDDSQFETYAKDIGLSVGQFQECYKGNKHKARILKDQSTSVRLGARGTPAFFINGRFLSGAQPFPAFDKLVSEELQKAKKSGVSKGEYYKKQVVAKGQKKV